MMKSDQLAEQIERWQLCLSDQMELLAALQREYDATVAAEKAARGASSGVVDVRYTRLIEFSADAIPDDFGQRWSEWDSGRRFEFYQLGTHGNTVFRQNYKPAYDADRGALRCDVAGNINGSPSLGTLIESPLYSYGTDDQPRYMRAGVPYRFSCEIEFSQNMVDMLMWAKANSSRDPWLTLVQIKNNGSSWWPGFVLLLGWNRTDDHLYLLLRGDSRDTKQPVFENDLNIQSLPITPGRRQLLTWDQTLDSSGDNANTKVWWDGVQYIDSDDPNCVPAPTSAANQARGIYIGTYAGNFPMLPETFSVWYSNISIDVWQPAF